MRSTRRAGCAGNRRAGDTAALFACRSHPEVERHQGWRPAGVDGATDFIARQATQVFGAADSGYPLAIRRHGGEAPVGDLGIHFPATIGEAIELGVSLMPSAQGRGHAREAMTAAIDQVFGMGCRRVVGSVDPRNRSCVALLRVLGFARRRITGKACTCTASGSTI